MRPATAGVTGTAWPLYDPSPCWHGDTHSSLDLTDTGRILGSARYVAPEQAEGNVRAIGPATDIHALGAILYESCSPAGRPLTARRFWKPWDRSAGRSQCHRARSDQRCLLRLRSSACAVCEKIRRDVTAQRRKWLKL